MFGMRTRRAFIMGLGLAAACPFAARAQQSKRLRLGSLALTQPNGKSLHLNIAQITFIRSDTQISGANAEFGLASGRVQGVKEHVAEIMRLVTDEQRAEMSWIALTEPSGERIYVNVSQVTSVRFDTQIPRANAELGFTSGKLQGVREQVDDIMKLIAAIAER